MSERNGREREASANLGARLEHDITRRVREFYEQFHFPGIRPSDRDGLILMRRMAKIGSNQTAKAKKLQVLDAGCGTGNTALSLARQFREMDFLGVDISGPSLVIANEASSKMGLSNLRFREWDLMEPIPDEGMFDIVLCLGVLHHTADMEHVLTNLRGVLSDQGELYLWVYGKHGRYRHSLNQRLLAMLLKAKNEPENRMSLAKEFVLQVGHGVVIEDLFGDNSARSRYKEVFTNSAWVADQFLHPNEILMDMEKLLWLLAQTRFELDMWLGVPEDLAPYFGSPGLNERFKGLARGDRFIALDLLLKPDHYFITLRKAFNDTG